MDVLINTCPGSVNGFPAFLFAQLIQSLIRTQCNLVNEQQYPPCYGSEIADGEQFDFIVVGAGSAGAAVAGRLSENPNWRILLVEAGGNPTHESEIPALLFSTQGSSIDWKFRASPNGKSCLGMNNQECVIPRGKVLGGCSTINAMLYVRGSPADYDEWEDLGNPGWSYEKVLPYFKKLENAGNDDKYHSSKGPVLITNFSQQPDLAGLKSLIVSGFAELGYPPNKDFSAESPIGFGTTFGTLKDNSRANTAKAYLSPIKEKTNLKVLKNALVEKVLFDGKKAVGVLLSHNGKTINVKSKKEVVLSAGAINSPQILLLSGVGPKEDLKKLGINVIHDLKGVGKNLQDHLLFPALPIIFGRETSKEVPQEETIEHYLQFLTKKEGMFAGIGLTDLLGFVDTSAEGTTPDLQFHFAAFPKGNPYFIPLFAKSANYKPEIVQQYIEIGKESDFILMVPTLLRPKSKGTITLSSTNPNQPPIIYSNYLDAEEDIKLLIAGNNLVKKVLKTQSLKYINPEEKYFDIPECNKYVEGSDEFLTCLARHVSTSVYHHVGTCKMGPISDPLAVVDNRLKVHGLEGLRVIDASIMPNVVRGNTNVPTIMIGEKGADLIKEDFSTTLKEEL